MAVDTPKLNALEGEEAPEELVEDANIFTELSESEFESFLTLVLGEGDTDLRVQNVESIGDHLESEIEKDSDKLESAFQVVLLIMNQSAKQNLSEGQIRRDIESIGLSENRAETLSAKISERMPQIKQYLFDRSRIDPAPSIRQLDWTVEKVVSTTEVQGINERRILLRFDVEDDGEHQEITLQADEGQTRELISKIASLQEEMFGGIDDIE